MFASTKGGGRIGSLSRVTESRLWPLSCKPLDTYSSDMTKEDFKSVGVLLKQRRKEMNISLKEAENATSIRINYLQSIEEGDMSKLISPVYANGFMRQYAAFLGLDGERLIREHPEIFGRPDTQDFAYGIGTLEVRGNPGSGIKWFPNALWIGAITLMVVLAWYAAKFLEII
jgi:cytoskeletal protein RodZ